MRVFFSTMILAVLGAGLAPAQTIDFNLFVTLNGNTYKEPNGATVPLTTQVNTQVSATVMAVYAGTTQATITGPPSNWVLGETQQLTISVPNTETFPLTLTTGQALAFTVTFAPPNPNGASVQVQIPYTETSSTGAAPTTSDIVLSFSGTSPAFTLSYALAPNNNVVQIPSGGTIPFLPTQINTTATGTLLIIDTGSGQGTITGVSLAQSSVFSLSGTPPFPYTLTPGTNAQSLEIGISYAPKAVETDTGQITITYQGRATATVNLSGSGTTSTYTYTYLNGAGGAATPVSPNGTITLPSVTVPTSGTTTASSSVIVTVKNTGSANGVINSIQAVPSPPFGVSGVPPTPPTLAPGGSPESFEVTFTPTQVGTQTGTLVVGNDTFVLSAVGLAQLTFSYVSNGSTIPVATGGPVVFPSVAVSQSAKVTFKITNSGTSAQIISLVSTNSPFAVPAFSPTTLATGQSTTFPITFTPTAVGSATGTLLVNSTQFSLIGSGNTPPVLPSYTFTGPSGNVSPASQDGVSLTLSKPYGVDLNGVLTLTTSGEFGTDSNVQFVTGERTVDFVIPANSTSADFAGQGSQILLQTGTVAETVTLAPTFTTSGGVPVTPASPPTLQFTIPSSAPVLESAQVTDTTSSTTSASFTLVLVGYSTTRSLNSLNVTFNAASGFNLATTQFPIDLSGPATVWFQSASAQSFGGQFQISETFNLTGSVAAKETLLDTIASVSATVSNSIGASNSEQGNVQ
jgi:hypothetical protein